MTGLRDFLAARYDETEEVARAATHPERDTADQPGANWHAGANGYDGGSVEHDGKCYAPVVYDKGSPSDEQARHIALHDPASALLDLEAKRRLLALHHDNACDECRYCGYHGGNWPCETLLIMALPFAAHPGYLPEWAPHEAPA